MRFKALAAAVVVLLAPLAPAQADQDSALAAVRSKPGVMDAQIDTRGNLWVMVKNANIAWDQYAAFMCGVVRPHQARVFAVHVVDFTSVGRGRKSGEWKQLAQMNCAALQ